MFLVIIVVVFTQFHDLSVPQVKEANLDPLLVKTTTLMPPPLPWPFPDLVTPQQVIQAPPQRRAVPLLILKTLGGKLPVARGKQRLISGPHMIEVTEVIKVSS